MTFVMSQGVPHRPGLRKWVFYERGKRWPYYRGHVVAPDFKTAHKHFREFVKSARAHRSEQ